MDESKSYLSLLVVVVVVVFELKVFLINHLICKQKYKVKPK